MQHLEDLIKRLYNYNTISFIYDDFSNVEYIYNLLDGYKKIVNFNDCLIITNNDDLFDKYSSLTYFTKTKVMQICDFSIKVENNRYVFLKDRIHSVLGKWYDLSLMIREHKLNIIKNI